MKTHKLTADQIADYSRWLYAEEHASSTVEKYLRDVRRFAAWLGEQPVTKEALTDWKAYLQAQQCAPSTVMGPWPHSTACFASWVGRIAGRNS